MSKSTPIAKITPKSVPASEAKGAVEAQSAVDVKGVQLAGKHIDSNVNNPSENIGQWKAGMVRPLCIFSAERMGLYAVSSGN